MYKRFENAIATTRKDCSQLFFVYSGLMRQIGGMRPLDFLQQSALDDRNVVLFKDPYKAGYRRGISEQVSSLDALVEWQREYRRSLPHVRDVYCVGVSAGAFPAMYSAYHLKAKAMWTFGARPLAAEFWGREPGVIAKDRQMRSLMTAEEIGEDDRPQDAVDQYLRELDLDMVNMVRELLLTPNGVTEYHLCYVPSNECDSLAHTMVSDLPHVTSHAITPLPDYPYMEKPNWDHAVLSILNHRGDLKSVFPAFAPT